MKKTLVLSTLAITGLFLTSLVHAQPYNLRGSFDGWANPVALTDNLDGTFSATIAAGDFALNPGDRFFFKVETGGWASSWPGSDAKSLFDAAGDFTVIFEPGAIADGWNPTADRVGYDDPDQFGWEIDGSFNGWDMGVDSAARQMTAMGGGLYSVDYNIATAGTHDFKFHESGSWDIAIGDDFGNSAANNSITTLSDNTVVTFQLDLPNGRWTTIVPEPTTMALAGLGLAALLAIRRKS